MSSAWQALPEPFYIWLGRDHEEFLVSQCNPAASLFLFIYGRWSSASRSLLTEHLAARQRDRNEKSSGVAVLERLGSHLNLVTGLDGGSFPAGANQKGGRIHLQVPDFSAAFAVLHFHFDP